MTRTDYARPVSLDEALALADMAASAAPPVPSPDAQPQGGRVWLAGGQSLLAAMKLGMATPSLLIDLQDLPGLRDIRLEGGAGPAPSLWIGAMATHASVAASEVVRQFAPGLCELAGHIADAQVRQMGTIGGSLAHNDPAACWPTGVLATGATIVTSRREIAADDYFLGLYTTALEPGELIVGVRFAQPLAFQYLKFEQPASRFALVGVAVCRRGPEGRDVRVAVTGLGEGVQRWREAEAALSSSFSVSALRPAEGARPGGLQALSDLHASAGYRCHLAGVLACRCVSAMGGGALPAPAPLARKSATAAPVPASEPPRDGFGGVQDLDAPAARVWQVLLDAQHLQACIPGCESLAQTSAESYEATVKVGLGPLSVRFKTDVLLRDQRPPQSLTLIFKGNAGALGSGQGTSLVRLESLLGGQTRLHWWVQVQLGGRLAQFGNRLVEATSRKLSAEFFDRVALALKADGPQSRPLAKTAPWWRRLLQFLFLSSRK